ncbi:MULTISPECIES: dienelactone hydrolase family protein [unclassified Bradyrhizobium]|uniref:dienelactone hydrolase family protein n=1 Tax=unclassified Bradyrhizobium TaxID=2631580 RepID=UPI0003F90202|nr:MULTISPECIES: dienelactone hydrolase family protein [unclassified Bradyrhizobium]QIG92937.1 hypothetical protein G6P99_10770 [Bradyrhizobium sp. 6(2017)]
MHTRDIDYAGGDATLRGYLAFNDAGVKRPGVLVFHEGLGLGDFAMERTRRLAEHGYVALAADMFGERRQAADLQQAMTLIGGLRTNPAMLRARSRAALATLTALVLTGADDPLAPPDQVVAFENEMRAGKVADWQVISYGTRCTASPTRPPMARS